VKSTKLGNSRRAVLQSLCAAPLVLRSPGAWGKSSYPDRPIRLVMTLPAGTSADTMARFIAERLHAELGQAVWLDNRPGASSNIGYQAASTAPADGHTLLYGLLSLILNPHLFKTLPYKPSDFTPIIHLLNVPFVLVVRADSPYRSVQELLDAAKADPDKLTYPSYGLGSANHVAVLQMLQATGAKMIHVPYKDGGLNDLLGGRLDCSLDVTATTIPHITSGSLRPLVVSTRQRLEELPDVPTFEEARLGVPLYSWNGMFARAGTPPEIINRLSSALQTITARDDFRKKVKEFLQIPRGGTPEEFASFLTRDSDNWGRIVAKAGIRIE
jgi:tripartite-type tricarboxylate transporter receptor subunit TctC